MRQNDFTGLTNPRSHFVQPKTKVRTFTRNVNHKVAMGGGAGRGAINMFTNSIPNLFLKGVPSVLPPRVVEGEGATSTIQVGNIVRKKSQPTSASIEGGLGGRVGMFCRQSSRPGSEKPRGLSDPGSRPSNGSSDAGFGVRGGAKCLRNCDLPVVCFKPWGPGGFFGGTKNAFKIGFHVFRKKVISFRK